MPHFCYIFFYCFCNKNLWKKCVKTEFFFAINFRAKKKQNLAIETVKVPKGGLAAQVITQVLRVFLETGCNMRITLIVIIFAYFVDCFFVSFFFLVNREESYNEYSPAM